MNPDHQSHPFLRAMAPEHRAVILQGATEHVFAAGEVLFREGHPANQLYLLHQGHVTLETHVPGRGDVPVAWIMPGQVLGWSWLMPPFVWQFQGRAVEATRATVLNGGHLLVASEQNHFLGYELMKGISKVVLEVLVSAHRRWLETGHRVQVTPAQTAASSSSGALPLQERMAEQPFFHGLASEYLQTLGGLVRVKTFDAGDVLFRAGTTADGLHVLEQGCVLIESSAREAPVPLHVLRPGDGFGWSSFWEPFEWHFDGRALEPTSTFFFAAADLRERCASDYHFAYELMKRITRMMLRHLQSTRNGIRDGVYSHPSS